MTDLRLGRCLPEFAERATEHAYRLWAMPDTVGISRPVLLIGGAVTLLFGVNDVALLGWQSTTYALLLTRVVPTALAGAILWRIRRPIRPCRFDRAMVSWAGLVQVPAVAGAMTRPPDFVSTMLALQTLLLGMLVFVPLRIRPRLIISLGGAVLTIAGWAAVVPGVRLGTIVPAMLFTALAGVALILQLERLRRFEYARLMEVEAANAQLSVEMAERARLAAELASREQSLSKIFEVAPVPMSLADAVTGEMLRSNRAVPEMLGLDPERHGPLNVLDFYDDPQERHRIVEQLSAAGRINDVEFAAHRQDGSPLRLSASGRLLELDGRPCMLGAWIDISARHEAAEALRRAKEAAERADQAKSRFLAMVSHEIRTPMNGVLGMLQLVESGELDPVQRRQVAIARDSAESLTGLLDTIIDYARLDAEIDRPVPVDLELAELLEATIELMRPRAAAKGIGLELDLAGPLPYAVRADPRRLRQVLVNLLSNAVKFTEAGRITLGAAVEGSILYFRVEDTGIGMPAEALDRIFDEFTQADDGIARRYGGSGLGLAVCRRLVELMGGTIGVASTPRMGSVFTVAVPVEPGAAPELFTPGTGGRQRLEVLVVDDDSINQMVASGLLAQLGHSATVAASGDAALELLGQRHFDLVLMDLHMPGMDGFETVRRLRQRPDTGCTAVPVVALTADLAAADDARVAALGFAGVVTKPVRRAALDAALHVAVGRAERSDGAGRSDRLAADQAADATYIAEQTALLGVAALDRLYRQFRTAGRQTIGEIVDAVRRGDGETVRFLAHRLAGSSASLGFGALRAQAEAIERAASSGGDGSDRLAKALRDTFEDAYIALRNLVRETRLTRQSRPANRDDSPRP
ncbi:ATP-binding protein [Bradyrhizobium sp. CB82]|uniref:hybrid sensor histidine kinase/response regulator n=1 Tax=Bradyrhizobium sp. CB82 TaxID=3039159 RepID=UPI0024B06AD3|nr:ATP-binding protein [Bradyrhizobium sp. CB82]WFU37246.1 ATP-binding protein [Bradyrhizobium sp. CB82]